MKADLKKKKSEWKAKNGGQGPSERKTTRLKGKPCIGLKGKRKMRGPLLKEMIKSVDIERATRVS